MNFLTICKHAECALFEIENIGGSKMFTLERLNRTTTLKSSWLGVGRATFTRISVGGRPTSLHQGLQKLLEAIGHVAHHVTGVAVLGQQEGQLQVGVLLQLDLTPIATCQLICCILCHAHHMIDEVLEPDAYRHNTKRSKSKPWPRI